MIATGERGTTARLFYDARCGSCSFFARVVERWSRSRIRALPYDGEEARRALGDLPEEERFASAHLVDGRGRRSGPAILAPIVGWTLGATGERVAERAPPVRRGLRWIYLGAWNYRRTRGCAADRDDPPP
jgi:predicted DCC family thiol-disulfide oxidoreductase YuxK